MESVLLRNKTGRLVLVSEEQAQDLLENSFTLKTVKEPNYEVILPKDPKFDDLVKIALGQHPDHEMQLGDQLVPASEEHAERLASLKVK